MYENYSKTNPYGIPNIKLNFSFSALNNTRVIKIYTFRFKFDKNYVIKIFKYFPNQPKYNHYFYIEINSKTS